MIFLFVMVFFFISLLPFLWMDFPYVRRMEELHFVNYAIVLRKYFYSWIGRLGMGFPNFPSHISPAFPNSVFYYIGGLLGLDISVIQALFLSLVIFATLLSTHTLILYLTKNKTAAFLASLFYLFNFYTANAFFYSAKMYQLILMPLFFVFLSKFLETRRYKYAVYNFILLFLFQAVFCNLPQAVTTFSVYLVAILHFKFNHREVSWRRVLRNSLLFFLPLLPLLFYHGLIYFFWALYVPGSFRNIQQVASFKALSSRASDVFQLRGAWWERAMRDGIPFYNAWLWFYEHPLVILASFILVIAVFAYLLLQRQKRTRGHYLFFTVFFLVSILLTVGTRFPFVYKFLYQYMPFFYIFRESWAKFVPLTLFFFTILLGYVVAAVKKRGAILLFTFLILLRGANFFSPNFFRHEVREWSSPEFKLPQYWKDFEEFSRDPLFGSQLVLVTPLAGTGSTYYWYPKRGNTNIFLPAYYTDFDLLSSSSKTLDFDPSIETIQYFPVRFVLRQNDAVVDNEKSVYLGFDDLVKRDLVEATPSFSFGNGALELYKTRKDKFAPKFFVPTNIIYSSGGVEDLVDAVSFGDDEVRMGVYLGNSNLKSQISNLENERILERADEVFVVGKRIRPVLELLEPEWRKGWAWPEANISPESWKYPLVRLKEQWMEWRAKEPLEKADVLLWHGCKRIEEIKKFAPQEGTEIEKLGNLYFEKVGRAVGILQSAPEKERDEEFWGMVGKALAYTGRVEEDIREIEELHNGFREWVEDIADLWGEDEYHYEIEIPKDGEYEVFLGGEDVEILNTGILDIDGEELRPIAERGEKNWVGFGRVRLGKGRHVWKLEIPLTEVASGEESEEEVPFEPKMVLRTVDELTNNELTGAERQIPKITFTKVNPTKYRVRVEGAKEPYTLVFSESFHQGWKIYQAQGSELKTQSDYGEIVASYFDGDIKEGTHRSIFLEPATFETWGKRPVEADHLLVNGYANSWYIKPEDVDGAEDYELIVEFWPQRLFYVGLFVSLTALLGCLVYLGYDFTRRWR